MLDHHLNIDEQIWIRHDGTEGGSANELVAMPRYGVGFSRVLDTCLDLA